MYSVLSVNCFQFTLKILLLSKEIKYIIRIIFYPISLTDILILVLGNVSIHIPFLLRKVKYLTTWGQKKMAYHKLLMLIPQIHNCYI